MTPPCSLYQRQCHSANKVASSTINNAIPLLIMTMVRVAALFYKWKQDLPSWDTNLGLLDQAQPEPPKSEKYLITFNVNFSGEFFLF